MIFFYLLVSLMPFSNPPLLSRFMGDLTAFKSVGAICIVSALLHLGRRGNFPHYFRTWQARLFLLYYVIAAVSYFSKSLSSDFFSGPFMIVTSFLVLFFITVSLVDSVLRLRSVLLWAVWGVAFAALHVIREWRLYHNVLPDFRPGSSVGEGNYFATSTVLCLPFIFLLMLRGKKRWERWFGAGCLLISLVGVTLCASRGAFLALVAAFLVLVWRSRRRLRNLAVISALALPLTLLLPVSPVHRLLHPSQSDRDTEEFRFVAWKAGLRMIKARPLTGIGLGNFKSMMPSYVDPGEEVDTVAHNAYIEIAAELGIPAMLVFLGILWFAWQSLERFRRQALRHGPPLLSETALGIQAGLLGYAVGSLFLSAEYQKLFWLALFLTMCLPTLQQSCVAADAADQSGAGAEVVRNLTEEASVLKFPTATQEPQLS